MVLMKTTGAMSSMNLWKALIKTESEKIVKKNTDIFLVLSGFSYVSMHIYFTKLTAVILYVCVTEISLSIIFLLKVYKRIKMPCITHLSSWKLKARSSNNLNNTAIFVLQIQVYNSGQTHNSPINMQFVSSYAFIQNTNNMLMKTKCF